MAGLTGRAVADGTGAKGARLDGFSGRVGIVEQALHRGALAKHGTSGRLTEKDLYATIGELAAGKKKGVVAPNERVICIPIGTGAMDVSVATLAWERAKEKGIGGTYSFVEY